MPFADRGNELKPADLSHGHVAGAKFVKARYAPTRQRKHCVKPKCNQTTYPITRTPWAFRSGQLKAKLATCGILVEAVQQSLQLVSSRVYVGALAKGLWEEALAWPQTVSCTCPAATGRFLSSRPRFGANQEAIVQTSPQTSPPPDLGD